MEVVFERATRQISWVVYDNDEVIVTYDFNWQAQYDQVIEQAVNSRLLQVVLLRFCLLDVVGATRLDIGISCDTFELDYLKKAHLDLQNFGERRGITMANFPTLERDKLDHVWPTRTGYQDNEIMLAYSGGKDSFLCKRLLEDRGYQVQTFTFNFDSEPLVHDFRVRRSIHSPEAYQQIATQTLFDNQGQDYYQEEDMDVIYAASLMISGDSYTRLALGLPWDVLEERAQDTYIISESRESVNRFKQLARSYGYKCFDWFSPIASLTSFGVYHLLRVLCGSDFVEQLVSCWQPQGRVACGRCDKCERVTYLLDILKMTSNSKPAILYRYPKQQLAKLLGSYRLAAYIYEDIPRQLATFKMTCYREGGITSEESLMIEHIVDNYGFREIG